MGRAFFTVIAAIAQLERELIVKRFKNGLHAARLRGMKIGRAKMRDSDLIRKLLKSGLTYRASAAVARCPAGSVYAETLEIKKEAAEQERVEKLAAEEDVLAKANSVFSVTDSAEKKSA